MSCHSEPMTLEGEFIAGDAGPDGQISLIPVSDVVLRRGVEVLHVIPSIFPAESVALLRRLGMVFRCVTTFDGEAAPPSPSPSPSLSASVHGRDTPVSVAALRSVLEADMVAASVRPVSSQSSPAQSSPAPLQSSPAPLPSPSPSQSTPPIPPSQSSTAPPPRRYTARAVEVHLVGDGLWPGPGAQPELEVVLGYPGQRPVEDEGAQPPAGGPGGVDGEQ